MFPTAQPPILRAEIQQDDLIALDEDIAILWLKAHDPRGCMIDLERLAKVWTLTSSPNAGEAAAARNRAKAMVEKAGKTLADVPDLLKGIELPEAAPSAEPESSAFDEKGTPDHGAAETKADRKRRAARAAKEAPARAEVLSRYGGSVDAVLDWTREERLLRDAVAQWSAFWDPPNQRWTRRIDGSDVTDLKPLTERSHRALERAYPLPKTITAAMAEYEMWERRDNDLGLVLQNTADTQLDLPAYFRREIVRRLLETDLVAASLDEVIIRQRYLVESSNSNDAIERAVLRDLEVLAASGRKKPFKARVEEPRASKLRRPQPRRAAPIQPDMFA